MESNYNLGKIAATGIILLFVVIGFTGSAYTFATFQDEEIATAQFFANGPNLLTGPEESNDVSVTYQDESSGGGGGGSEDKENGPPGREDKENGPPEAKCVGNVGNTC